MLEVMTSSKGKTRIIKCRLNGTLLEITADVLHAIRQIHRQISEKGGPSESKLFKEVLIDAVTSKDLDLFTTKPLEGALEIRAKPKGAGPS